MPRTARLKHNGDGLYHIIERGNERRDIFHDDADRVHFLTIVRRNQIKYGFGIYAYCLMTNHIHLLVASHGTDISQVMKSINISYVIYFNRRYQRCGHLFQDRFKSDLVESNEYLMEVSRYIHLNPARAGIISCEQVHEYPWSSYQQYLRPGASGYLPVDTGFILGLFAADPLAGRSKYQEYVMRDDAEDKYSGAGDYGVGNVRALILPGEQPGKKSPGYEISALIQTATADYAGSDGKKLSHDAIQRRNQIMRELRRRTRMTLKELGQLFGGLSESMVGKILRDE